VRGAEEGFVFFEILVELGESVLSSTQPAVMEGWNHSFAGTVLAMVVRAVLLEGLLRRAKREKSTYFGRAGLPFEMVCDKYVCLSNSYDEK
jgi:hypothetical protein